MLFTVNKSSVRIDLFLVNCLPDLTRAQVQNLIKDGNATVNSQKVKASTKLQLGDVVSVLIPPPSTPTPTPENLPLHVLFEDEHIIVVNKDPGMVVHPAPGNESGTLVNALLHHCGGRLADAGGESRPGIVHRLDKDTSGCIIAAKTNAAYHHLVAQFHDRTSMKKTYLAVTAGVPTPQQDTIFSNIGRHPVNRKLMAVVNPPAGKSAITDYQVVAIDQNTLTALLLCVIFTGRTHQIRVHLKQRGVHVLGDPIYGKKNSGKALVSRLMLHAWRLQALHPITSSPLNFTAPIPQEFAPWLDLADLSAIS